MNVLVAVADYPNNNGGVILMYVHARNRYYCKHGIDVTVLNFAANESYIYEDVQVITLEDYKTQSKPYDVLICHAANLRNHYLFLRKYGDCFPKLVFFFHGHEVLKVRDTYRHSFPFVKNAGFENSIGQDIYDEIKFFVWKRYYRKVSNKSVYIFVSRWMKERFEKYLKISTEKMESYIIPNNVGEVFELQNYDFSAPKEFDFVTIRSRFDGWKYCIDVVNRLANENPQYRFLVIGKGEYFEHYKKAKNIELRIEGLSQDEIPGVLNSASCALMPTRLDAQGVMMCEMSTYGIPVITSNIDICRELNELLNNLILVDHDKSVDLKKCLEEAKKLYSKEKNKMFFTDETVGKEVSILIGMTNEN